ncbi:hypothetical protein L195_g024047 [Trifolium pratense]|uniref:Uncharacterized protein n=1 Tax=Trifolium pratense TaxID=57577 RepID=A0A2K3NCJ0_TRIPR|nr:hypothetical protein L195_g024047 [Trifolium pratense]
MTCSQEAEFRGLTASWPTIATNFTGGSSVVTGELTVVDDELRQKGEVNEIEDGEEKEKGKRLEEEKW